MRASIAFTAILSTALSFVSKTWAAPDPNFHIYLAFGQSNMQGAGQIENQDKTVDKRFQMIATAAGCNNRRVGEWYDAIPPLAHCGGGLGPVDYFGRTLVKKLPEQIKVGVAVVAVAGCDIQLFEKNNYRNYQLQSYMVNTVNAYGGNPYGRLIEMGKKAQQVGVIKGILFHQGEANAGQQNWPNRVKTIYDNILNDLDLNAMDIPLLVGEVVPSENGGKYGEMNSIIKKITDICSTCHIISSEGLSSDDGINFVNYRIIGQRYVEKMMNILNRNSSIIPDNGCWSERLGYPCCQGNEVAYTDDDGDWGIENNNWCGIIKYCWSETLGFPCCSTGECKILYYVDSNGSWSTENEEWCGITPANTIC